MGRLAFEALLAHYNDKSVPPEFILPVTLMVRRSCGCLSEAVLRVNEGLQADEPNLKIPLAGREVRAGVLLKARREVLLDEMQRTMVQDSTFVPF